MSGIINIEGLDRAEVLAALYNASKQQGLGFLHERGASGMTTDQAREVLKRTEYFDYLHGRVMKVAIEQDNDELDPRLYDRDNGDGAAHSALSGLLAARAK